MTTTLLQVVPQAPGCFDGVGDYALGLAKALAADHGHHTIFAAANPNERTSDSDYPVIGGLDAALERTGTFDHVILHYANYGYQRRGVPLRLRRFARQLRKKLRGRWISTFHELYAFGPPWKSAFWLYPLQAQLAHEIIDLADVCFVSSDTINQAIHKHDAAKSVRLLPVMSNFGEPPLTEFGDRPWRRWVICGGTELIVRSLRSFIAAQPRIHRNYLPDQVDVVGGRETEAVRRAVRMTKRLLRGVVCRYYPEIAVCDASDILRQAAFGWIDYFGEGTVWPGMIFKSGSFAACCAHGVVPILSHEQPPPPLDGDPFPAWHFITARGADFPAAEQLGPTAEKIYSWYHRHASSRCAGQAYAEALR